MLFQQKSTEKQRKLKGCRPKKALSDTAKHPWDPEDRVRWVEWRVRELTIERGEYIDGRGKLLLEAKAAAGRKLAFGDKVAEYAVWLLRARDGLSWHQLAYRFFPSATEQNIETFESRVRRVYNRVERNHPGSKHYKPARQSDRDNLLFRSGIFGGGFF